MPISSTWAIDDAAVAALRALEDLPQEHIGVIYQDGDSYKPSNTIVGGKGKVRGTLQVPAGAARALFHNHPLLEGNKKDRVAETFSQEDKDQANRLGLPSYIIANGKLLRYDPSRGGVQEVLAEFPIDEWKKSLLRSFKLARNNINNSPINDVKK